MPHSTRARRQPVLLLAVVLASAAALVATSLSTPAQAATTSARAGVTQAKSVKTAQHDRTWRAHHALLRAQKAFSSATPASERPDATMALRKLWMLKDSLAPAERAAAEKLAQRPVKPAVIGDANIALHYDPAELNPAAFDANTALAQLQYVADTYANSGYRRPKPDKGRGGDNRIDIYLDSLPTTAQLAAMYEGAMKFPQVSDLVAQAVYFHLASNQPAAAAALTEVGLRYARDAATRAKFERIKASFSGAKVPAKE